MAEIVQKGTITIKRKYVYWLVQLMFVTSLAGFLYTYMTNKDITQWLDKVETTANGEPAFVKFIYGKFGGGEFDKPMAVSVVADRIFVADTNNKRVQIFDYAGNPLKTFGKWGDKPGEFQFPYGIAGDSKGVIYVADLYKGSVAKFDKDGKFLGLFAEKKESDQIFKAPAGITVKDDLIYITDVQLHSLRVFDLTGKLVKEVGKPGQEPGRLYAPNAVSVDGEGNMYVTNTGNQRIDIFDKTGKFVKILNGSIDGKGPSVFVNPRGIGVDDQGNVFVVSNLTHRLYVFDKDGKQKFNLGGYGEGEKQFALPNGLFVDDRGRVYVTDTMNLRVAVFQS
ncbi:MAG: 6-bladed beta-propeller [Thermincola sp.]|jgi:DNA-binding beta-propeller fold protein YncE|nr:6-bladed beta-propeller [Thermincola sp.]MDT3704034.1 6-bladed beta-propeller [Thermincola sp.]